ncbi:MAG: hypothetical protein KDA50_00320 [Rhodobacteraceae bacterium]|nr:hypothetical protein [Paracoccaceae bacterium]
MYDHESTSQRRAWRGYALGTLLVLAACAPEGYDEDPLFTPAGELEIVPLAPVAPVLDAAAERAAAPDAIEGLDERGAALRHRADALRTAP